MVMHIFNPGTQEAEADKSLCEFEAKLVYIPSSRKDRAEECDPNLKIYKIFIKEKGYITPDTEAALYNDSLQNFVIH